MKLTTLKDLFEHELQDIHSAEEQIIEALPKMIEKTTYRELKRVLSQHLEQTKGHLNTVEEMATSCGMKASGQPCKGMEGIIAEGDEIISMIDDPDLRDATIIMAVQRVEHYEISGYGTVVAHARELGLHKAEELSMAILSQEYETDSNLTDIAESRINSEADDSNSSKMFA